MVYSICAKGAQCYLGTRSALTFLGGADLIILVGSDSYFYVLLFTSL